MPAPVLAEATDLPVWFLFIATMLLVGVTGGIAIAAYSALDELKVAVQQLE